MDKKMALGIVAVILLGIVAVVLPDGPWEPGEKKSNRSQREIRQEAYAKQFRERIDQIEKELAKHRPLLTKVRATLLTPL